MHQNLRYTRLKNERTDMFPLGLSADGIVKRYFRPVDTESTSVLADSRLQAHFATGALSHHVLLGMDYDPVYEKQLKRPSTKPTIFYAPARQLGLYPQDQLKWDRWMVTAGLHRDKATQSQTTTNVLTGAVQPDYALALGDTGLLIFGLIAIL